MIYVSFSEGPGCRPFRPEFSFTETFKKVCALFSIGYRGLGICLFPPVCYFEIEERLAAHSRRPNGFLPGQEALHLGWY